MDSSCLAIQVLTMNIPMFASMPGKTDSRGLNRGAEEATIPLEICS
jgi:hypothetical protein